MDNYVTRVSTLCTWYTFALAIVCAWNYLAGQIGFHGRALTDSADLSQLAFKKFVYSTRHKSDIGRVRLDNLEADVSNNINWSTKQLFMWASVNYATDTRPENEVVVWDTIVKTPEEAVFALKKASKYDFMDFAAGDVKGQNATVRLNYQYMPKVGFFRKREVGRIAAKLPSGYVV